MKSALITTVLLFLLASPALADDFSMEFKNTRVDDILRILADRYDASVTVSGAVNDSVTVNLDGLGLHESLDALLYGTNYIWQQDGDVIRVISANTIVTKIFPLTFSSSSDLAETLQAQNEDLVISAELHSNSILVTGPIPRVKNVGWVINSVDKYRSQVKIRADMVEITLGDEDVRGVDLNAVFSGQDITGSFTTLFSTGNEPTNLNLNTVKGDFDVTGLLAAMQETRDATLLSSPEIATLDNQTASILVGERVPYQQATTETETGATLAEVEFIDVGVKLEVTPTISDNDHLYLTIHTEVSEVLDQSVQNVPRIGTREADTRVMIKHGDTVVIGGLIKHNVVEVVKKVPVLGSIPGLGWFFKRTDYKETKTELLIFIHPEVVTAPEQLRATARQESMRDQYLGTKEE